MNYEVTVRLLQHDEIGTRQIEEYSVYITPNLSDAATALSGVKSVAGEHFYGKDRK